jgi:hypothetical protein
MITENGKALRALEQAIFDKGWEFEMTVDEWAWYGNEHSIQVRNKLYYVNSGNGQVESQRYSMGI